MPNELEQLSNALGDHYRVLRQLGAGGMATVYLADDLKHGRPVALKVLRPELAAALGPERFLREIALTARLDHPHILPLLDSGDAHGLLYYTMPYVEGESLRDRLTREAQLPLADALQITHEVADALSYAHGLGIVHRDIKPENILLGAGHARVADFGIARAVSTAGGASLTATGLAIGTPAYMSPEQARGAPDVDRRTDLYSLACVAYEMLAGQPPFTGATAEAILARKSLEAPPSLRVVRSTVPPGVADAIATALAPIPADRFLTTAQFADALRRAANPIETAPSESRRLRRRRLGVAVAVSAIALAAAWWGLPRLMPPPRIQSLAVLPFASLSDDPEQEYFAYGMTEELIARLSGVAGLTVKSRTSVMHYRNSGEPLPAIARALGVDALVEGSVSPSAERVRIRARLVRAQPERSLWANTYDSDLRDALAVQSQVARAIVEEIGGVLTPEQERRLARAAAVDPIAAEAYFKGRFYWNRRTAEDVQRAIGYFEQAIAIDSTFALPHAGLADCYVLLAYGTMSVMRPAEALVRAEAAARKALEINEQLAQAHTSLAYAETFQWKWEAAEQRFRRALAIDPAYGITHFWYAAELAATGRVEEAVARARQGQQVEPLSPIITAGVAWMLHFARRHDEAAQEAAKALRFEPRFAIAHYRLGVAYGWLGRYQDAVRELEAGLDASGGDPGYVAALVRVYAAAGREGEARRRLAELLSAAQRRYVPAYDIATAYAALDDRDRAFVWLERAFTERSLDLAFIRVAPELDPLRADPRLLNLQRRLFPEPGGR